MLPRRERCESCEYAKRTMNDCRREVELGELGKIGQLGRLDSNANHISLLQNRRTGMSSVLIQFT